MDTSDLSLLTALEQSGPRRIDAAAASLGLSTRTVRRRMDRMIRAGAMRVVAVPNPVACDFRAWTKIGIRVLPESLGSVSRTLVRHPSVYFAAHSLGRFDIIAALLLESNRALAHFVNSELAAIDGVTDVEPWVMVVPRKYHQFKWPAPEFRLDCDWWSHYREIRPTNQVHKLDTKHRRILSALREDGLLRPAALASQLGLGESTVRKCLREMRMWNLYELAAVPNPEALPDEVWATIGIRATKTNVHEVIDQIVRHSPVYLCTATLGRFDIIIGARFAGNGALNRFATETLPSVKGITSIETFVHYRPLKYHGIQWISVNSNGEGIEHSGE